MLLTLKPFKETIEFICVLIYAAFLQLMRKDLGRIVICYHSVKKDDVRQFEKQMAYLAKNHIVVKASHIKTVPTHSKKSIVAITFDDAFVSILKNAIPVLTKLGLTATIFVPTGNLARTPQWEISGNCSDKDELIMNRQQVSKLDKDGFEIFSHTVSHPVLTEIGHDMLMYELKDSKQALERILGHEAHVVSYPHGACNSDVCEIAKEVGYKQAFTIQPFVVDESTDDMQIGRFAVSPKNGLLKFRLKVSGAYQVTNYLGTLKRILL